MMICSIPGGTGRNRNKIKTPRGLQWLTIPVVNRGKFYQKIKDTEILDSAWCHDHWKALTLNYGKAPYFKMYEDRIEGLYQACEKETHLSRVNYLFLTEICKILDIPTRITWSSDYELVDGKNRTPGRALQVRGRNRISLRSGGKGLYCG